MTTDTDTDTAPASTPASLADRIWALPQAERMAIYERITESVDARLRQRDEQALLEQMAAALPLLARRGRAALLVVLAGLVAAETE